MYCSISDLEQRINNDQLIELSSETDERNDTIITKAITDATALVKGYCSKDFGDSVPALIADITADLSICNLYKFRNNTDNEAYQTRYKEAMSKLKDIAKGLIDLDVEDTENSSIQIISNARLF